MKNSGTGIQETYFTYSFMPFMLTLFRQDMVSIIENVKNSYPEARIQFGEDTLEYEVDSVQEMEEIAKKLTPPDREFHTLYIHIQASARNPGSPYLLLEINEISCNIFLSDPEDEGLSNLRDELRGILKKRNFYGLLKNNSVQLTVLAVDVLIVLYALFFKDIFEKATGLGVSSLSIIVYALMINLIFLTPRGRNKLFLQEKEKVSILKKGREWIKLITVLIVIVALLAVTLKLGFLK